MLDIFLNIDEFNFYNFMKYELLLIFFYIWENWEIERFSVRKDRIEKLWERMFGVLL